MQLCFWKTVTDPAVKDRGENKGDAVGEQLRCHNAVKSYKMIQDQQDRDGKQALSAHA